MAACVVGGTVVSSSRNTTTMYPSSARRCASRAHAIGSSRTPSGVETGKPPKSCGSRIEPTRMKTLHLIPARANPSARLFVNSVLPTPGKPVMCIGMRACKPIAIN